MRPPGRDTLAALVTSFALVSASTGYAQTTPSQTAAPAEAPATTSEVTIPITENDLARIRKALDGSPTLKIDEANLRYYVEILAKQRTFAEYVKGYDLRNGPTRGGNPMTHQEFLNMVTPRELNSSGGITALETLQFALTNWLGQTVIRKAIEDLQNARDQREIDEIRARIDRELAALKRDGAN